MKNEAATYYYADGRHVDIVLDEQAVAVDFSRPPAEQEQGWRRAKEHSQPLVRGLGLVRSADLPSGLRRVLDAAGGLHPVYRHGSAMLVVLPEVRVEIKPEQRASLLAFLDRSLIPAIIEQDDGESLTLRPQSGKGTDALTLANRLYEVVHPVIAQARFLRIVPDPAMESAPPGRGTRARGAW